MKLNKNLVIVIIFLGVILLFIFTSIAYLTLAPTNITQPPSERPPGPTEANEEFEEPEPEHIPEAVDLIDLTPYKGKNFVLIFDENEGLFYVYFNPNNRAEAEREFDEFIKQHGIPNRESFFALEESKSPIPTIEH